MEAVIQKPLGNVKGSHPGRLVLKTVKHELMLADRRDRKLEAVLERLLYIVCTKHRQRSHHLYILPSEHQDVCVCPQKHSEITHEAGDASAWLSLGIYDMVEAKFITDHLRHWKMLGKVCRNADRTCTGAAASVRGREGLVEIEMEHIEAHVARTYHTDKRVHVGTVVVKQTAALMDKGSNLPDILLEKS